jgi:hypothetical protein
MKIKFKGKKAQEEMVGFVVIIVLISVILLVLLSFMLRSPQIEAVNNYEVESFIQASLQYTSDCENQIEFLSVENLIVYCEEGETCLDGRDTCEVLNETLKGAIENSWNVKEGSAVKGYKLKIMLNKKEKLALSEGNETKSYKAAFQDFAKGSDDYELSLNVYY